MTESDSRPWYLDHMMTTTTTMMKMPVLMMMIINFHLKAAHHNFFVKPFQSHILRQKCKSMMVSCKTLLADTIEIKNQLFPTTKTNFKGGLLVHTI